ncbi:MFS transporter [Couchioplanes caeruleus]|uniref:MFS transporter n=2 Tax=Couchioplanes caeruleus TaxID=56438 RepID=A0A1K0FS56_9ACTN|nr:MFS transporter [Couchioplanes caeruleus]OJF15671.1 MFS transporter [Couchioplanes caeruleus subsp. caeruleus]ROP33850.1 DHA2 family multidrug resistance protein-like MFS transporter [Couchioplanes caeruleus]
MSHTQAPRAGLREWTGLAVLALPAMLIVMDMTVLHLAVPRLSADLAPTSSQLLWITDIYGFFVAGFLITMGTLGDRTGRRRLLLIGAAAFAAASVLAAYADSAEMLIAARALLGLAGATLMPSTLSLLRVMFLDERQRTIAISVWTLSFTIGASIGPLVGGLMLENFWWGSVFLMAVPVMVLLVIAGPALLPEYRADDAGRLDLISSALSLAAVLPAVYGIKEIARAGVSLTALLTIAAGLLAGWLFLHRQRRLADPLIDLSLFREARFSVSLGTLAALSFMMFGINLFIVQSLQLVHGLSPLEAGLWTLPGSIGGVLGTVIATSLLRVVRKAYVMASALGLAAAGLALVTQVGPADFALLVTGLAVISSGIAAALNLGTDLVVSSVPEERASAASAVSETGNEFGGALGLAVLGSVGTAVYSGQVRDELPAGIPAEWADSATETLAGALEVVRRLPAAEGARLADVARDAFSNGLAVISGIGAVLIAVSAAVVAVKLRDLQSQDEPEASPDSEDQYSRR